MTLHITNGDHAGDKLRTFVDGPVVVTADVLHEGPCPAVEGDEWHDARARFLAAAYGAPYEPTRGGLAAADAAMQDACTVSAKAAAGREDLVLWFEHDLFDQLLLIRILDLLSRRPPARVSLICIDRFPGVEPFIGLGQLTSEQLATLRGTATRVTAGHLRLAAETWAAFRSSDPRELLQVADQLSAAHVPVSEGGPALPFLGAALLRLLAEYPSAANGLSRTEELALRSLLDGPATAAALFNATQAREARPFMGDSTFFNMLERLAAARVPLVSIDAPREATDRGDGRITITGAGREVLAGEADHIRLNGIDCWRGGVHLRGADRSPWRWDSGDETLVS
ncbi:MAG: hypothetical protein JWL71_4753 [Acidobacteria bacterium]|nr:hypothetical protein [Acidobacteriota bacterium]